MIQLNFPSYIIKITESFLRNRKFCVCLNTSYSELIDIPAGVPQGSVLGPTLYILFCSDMPDLFGCESAAYADDTSIFYSHEFGQHIVTKLQCALDCLTQYFQKWKIKINEEKTQAVFFSRKRKSCFYPSDQLNMNGINIPWSENIKYLGVHLDKKLTYEFHLMCQIKKLCIARSMLYPLIKRNSPLSNENKLILAKVVFQSISMYACPVWGVCAKTHIQKLQVFQNKLLKMMLNLPWHFSTKYLHENNNISLIHPRIQSLTDRFKLLCSISSNPLINNLYN